MFPAIGMHIRGARARFLLRAMWNASVWISENEPDKTDDQEFNASVFIEYYVFRSMMSVAYSVSSVHLFLMSLDRLCRVTYCFSSLSFLFKLFLFFLSGSLLTVIGTKLND